MDVIELLKDWRNSLEYKTLREFQIREANAHRAVATRRIDPELSLDSQVVAAEYEKGVADGKEFDALEALIAELEQKRKEIAAKRPAEQESEESQ